MNFKDQEVLELTIVEIDTVTGGGMPENNPPGFQQMTMSIDNEPVNNPVGL